MLKFFDIIYFLHTFFGMYCKPVIRSGNQPGHCQIGSTRMSHLSFFSILLQTGYCYTAQYTMARLEILIPIQFWKTSNESVKNGVTHRLTKILISGKEISGFMLTKLSCFIEVFFHTVFCKIQRFRSEKRN